VLKADAASLGVEILICGGEPGAGIPEVRGQLQTAFRARVFDFGAGPGGSCQHPDYQGMHWVADDLILAELLDPASHDPVPITDGAIGELCMTALVPGAMSYLRACLGDIAQFHTAPCPCGQTGIRYRIVGRTDDMLKVKGVMVYPASIEGVIAGFVPQVTGEFRIVLERPPPRVEPPLRLAVERGRYTAGAELESLAERMRLTFHERLRITPRIEWVEPETLTRSLHKGQYFDRRYQTDRTRT